MTEAFDFLIEGFDPSKMRSMEQQEDKAWQKIFGAYQNDKIIQAPVVGIQDLATMKDGEKTPCAVVQIESVRGYIPITESGFERKRQLRTLAGRDVSFKVLQYDRENEIFIGSRTKALEHAAKMTLERIEVGDEIPAVAQHVTNHLVHADIGGIFVRIPIHDVRHGWIDDLTEEVHVGDHFYVKVLEVDKENQEVEVSAKATQNNPFPECLERFPKDYEAEGVVSGVTDYGVFVNLEPGVDSLARHLRFENVKKGDPVLVRILGADVDKEQIRTRILRILPKKMQKE